MTIKKGTKMFEYCHKCDVMNETVWEGVGKGDHKFFYKHFRHGSLTSWADLPEGWEHARFAGISKGNNKK